MALFINNGVMFTHGFVDPLDERILTHAIRYLAEGDFRLYVAVVLVGGESLAVVDRAVFAKLPQHAPGRIFARFNGNFL